MMLARADCPLDRLDDAMLICDAISAHAPAHVNDGHLNCVVTVGADRLRLEVDELSKHGAQGLIDAAVVPGVGNVLERLSDELRVDQQANEKLILGMNFPS
jgi:hypothetical protein